ncbi:MAG TPA: hypothetical protein VFS27_01945 [Blastocatellia bacterium]|nr:hypothetical protein [Blastocatellia bacterium]
MKQKRSSLMIAVALAVITLLTSSSTARTRAVTPKAPSTGEQLMALMGAVNAQLAGRNANIRVNSAAYLTRDDSKEPGQTVFFNDRAKQLDEQFVPFDPRRGGGADITYRVDQTEGAVDGLTVAQTTAAIDRAMTTWNNVNCSTLPITKLPDLPGVDIGAIESLLIGQPAELIRFADIIHAGWLPGGILPPDVIGVTFSIIFVDEQEQPTDIDNNGKIDIAFREILYNDAFIWTVGPINSDIDVETVALHESGHGLSQGHFGKAFLTNPNGKIHFAPLAVMNATYSGIRLEIKQTDNGGHCSIWGSWPNK